MYDHNSGTWLKMPLSWELHIPDISSRVAAIQEAFPDWNDKFEILALLRQCNYDLDEVTNTYITLLAEDTMKKQPGTKPKSRSSSSQEHAAEAELMKERIEQLEEKLREKESQLEESRTENEDLKSKLKSSEEVARRLQIKETSLQREIQQLKSAPEPTSQPVISPVQPSKAPTISKDTCRNIKSTVRYFSQILIELRNCFTSEMNGIASVLDQAQSSLRKMKTLDQGSSKEVIELRALYHKEVLERKLLYNKLQELRGNIRVFCRCRYDPKADNIITFSTDQDLNLTSATGQKKSFRFDRVFSPSSSQEEVFKDTLPLITSCVDGYNVCIMAYGQTGKQRKYVRFRSLYGHLSVILGRNTPPIVPVCIHCTNHSFFLHCVYLREDPRLRVSTVHIQSLSSISARSRPSVEARLPTKACLVGTSETQGTALETANLETAKSLL